MYIENHAHLFKEYYENIDKVIENAINNNIKYIVVSGCNYQTNLEVLELVKKYDIVYGTLGYHPTEIADYQDSQLKIIEDNINNPKIIAIGEIGLDYHYENTNQDFQKDVFIKQLKLAVKYQKPIIVHSRDCINETYNILSDYSLKGLIHCYSGSLEMARKFIKLGYHLGVGGVCTYHNAKNIIEVIKGIELHNILLETDSPYLTPVPYRGLSNEPKYIPIIANRIAEIKNISIEEVAEITTIESLSLFDF